MSATILKIFSWIKQLLRGSKSVEITDEKRSASHAQDATIPERENYAGRDWANLGYGPNVVANGHELVRSYNKAGVALKKPFVIDPEVAHRFNVYAETAMPREIGGLLRIRETEDEIRAIDLKVFPHVASSGGYFELDEVELSKFNIELVKDGRAAEIAEWCSLIHSHPNMEPFLSGTDRDNLFTLAGTTRAYSVICASRDDAAGNYFAVHYGQVVPTRLLIRGINVETDPGFECSGYDTLTLEEIETTREHAHEMLSTVRRGSLNWNRRW